MTRKLQVSVRAPSPRLILIKWPHLHSAYMQFIWISARSCDTLNRATLPAGYQISATAGYNWSHIEDSFIGRDLAPNA
eukprot:655331-Amphidinium_carterae.1